MELYRAIGIVDRVREAGASIASSAGLFQGHSLREVIEARPRQTQPRSLRFSGFIESTSPESGTFVTQDMLEPVLVDEARKRGVDIRFNTECTGIEETSNAVVANLKDRGSGEMSTIETTYLIAADGARSPICAQLQIPASGRGTMGHLLNILFHADLRELVRDREFSLCLIERPEVVGLFTSINNSDRWVFHLHFDPANGDKVGDFTPEKCRTLVRAALGIADIAIDIEAILPWEPSVRITERMRQGRIFLAGDAAHSMPPYAGQGANSGIADAHNLVWKLAAVLQGQASEKLLTTYEVERLPVGKTAAKISAMGCDDRGLLPVTKNLTFFRSVWQKLFIVAGFGYEYYSQAIIPENSWPLGGWTWRPWTIPSLMFAIDGRPGRRVPHIWVEIDSEQKSTLDICGPHFTVLAGANGIEWIQAAAQIACARGIRLDAYMIGPTHELKAAKGVFETAAGIFSHGVLLVRPDQFVAFRSRRMATGCQSVLESALKQACCLE
jgi:2-polyprenyl-6-methoxyphenol hydroxylase-like FAD-dependent oxidoreductase